MTLASTKRIGALALAATMFVAACGGSAATSAPATSPAAERPRPRRSMAASEAPAGGAVTGAINVSGSSTVEPISTAVAEAFAAANPGFTYTVEGPGTGDGFKKFCAGETDISDASRKIKDEEAKACADAGIEYVELKIAYDGMSVLTSVNNKAIACLSFADLYALIGPESTGFAKWSDAAAIAKELGSNTVVPGRRPVASPARARSPARSTASSSSPWTPSPRRATRSRKARATPPPAPTTRRRPTTTRSSTASPAPTPRSAGWASHSPRRTRTRSRRSRSPRMPNGTCVAPDTATISDGSYPLSRSLYIYVNKAKAAANPAVVSYVDYYLADGTISKVLETVPYVNLPADVLAETASTWSTAK